MKQVDKTTLGSILFLIFFIPHVALAAWWNPFSWFNSWSFLKKDNAEEKTELLENRIAELEAKLASSTENESPGISIEPQAASITPSSQKEVVNSVTPKSSLQDVPVLSTPNLWGSDEVQKSNADFSVKCEISKTNVDMGDTVKAYLKFIFSDAKDRTINYDILWSKYGLTKLVEPVDARYIFENSGLVTIEAIVTKKSNGFEEMVVCPTVNVRCTRWDCFSNTEKQISILDSIIDEINSWYDDSYIYSGPINRCKISESIIRAYEYEYELNDGKNIPEFSAVLDCSNLVAISTYLAKIQLLKDTLEN